MRRPRLTYANVASTAALLLALGGTAYAATLPANSVGSRQLKTSAVTSAKVGPNAITTSKIRTGAVTRSRIAVGAVDTARLANGAVTDLKMGVGSVGGAAIANGSVGAADLAASARAAATPLLFRVATNAILQVGPAQVNVATLPISQPGTYFLVVELRAFPRASNPGNNLNCSFSGVGGSPPSLINGAIPNQVGVTTVTFTGTAVVGTTPASARLNCNVILSAGEITLSYKVTAIRVTTA